MTCIELKAILNLKNPTKFAKFQHLTLSNLPPKPWCINHIKCSFRIKKECFRTPLAFSNDYER